MMVTRDPALDRVSAFFALGLNSPDILPARVSLLTVAFPPPQYWLFYRSTQLTKVERAQQKDCVLIWLTSI